MSPLLLAVLLVAALIALIPVWRLRVAAWPVRWLALAWFGYAAAIVFAIRAPAASRFFIPMLVLAFVAPFLAGPERLTRVLRGRAAGARPVINVTPRPPGALPDGTTAAGRHDQNDALEDDPESDARPVDDHGAGGSRR